jgi:hypothetical protein
VLTQLEPVVVAERLPIFMLQKLRVRVVRVAVVLAAQVGQAQ